MFENCEWGINLNVKNLNVKKPTNFKKCFDNCNELIPVLWDKEPNKENSMKSKCENCPYNRNKLDNGCGNDTCIQEAMLFDVNMEELKNE